MSGNILHTRNLFNLIYIVSKTNYHPRGYSTLSVNRHLSLNRRNFLRLSNNSFGNDAKRVASTETEVNYKSWIHHIGDLIHQINTHGIDSLEGKFIPKKRRKQRAEGEMLHKFIDSQRVKVIAGNGGDGFIYLQKIWLNEFGGPAGGDGGNGGHVIFKASKHKKCLYHLDSHIIAKSGENGKIKNCYGKGAPDLFIEVPVGTLFKYNGSVMADLEEEGDMFVAARGGAGGKGNSFFTDSVNQAPKIAEFGGLGEAFTYDVELRLMTDIGLIGFPNAGKSTLLRSISRARPKVAAYPFTTLKPHVGMVSFADYHQIAIADIPGLIEGSHSNLGLGMAFLKHVERCACLLYVLDASENPLEQFSVLKNELEMYEAGLSERPHALVLNKMDLPQAQENLPDFQSEVNLPVIPISAKMGQNLVQLLAVMRLLSELNSQTKN